ncbi:MAG TPA: glycosyltransferase family 4 protein, partial [Longimicrobiales bacterium]|nr:glycosyltransferase family 4 protein [Longimicrobiales bacterium]
MRRVLHLIDTTGPGGAETVFVTLVSRLPSADWESIPVVLGPGWVADTLTALGHPPTVIPSRRRLDLGYLTRLTRFIGDASIDLVHAHLATTSLYGGMAAAIRRVPCVATFHGLPDLEIGRLRMRLVARSTYRIVFVSRSLKDRATAGGLLPEGSATVIPNGIDIGRFDSLPGPTAGDRSATGEASASTGSDEVVVGALGNVRPLKDYPTFLRTAADLERRAPGRFRFVVAGDTEHPLYGDLLRLRRGLGLDDRVTFVGFQTDVPAFLRTLDVLLVTSSSEGFSLATVQAMAAGVPVVATRCGGPEEIIEHRETGLLADVGDPEALADAVLELAGDPGLRHRAR